MNSAIVTSRKRHRSALGQATFPHKRGGSNREGRDRGATLIGPCLLLKSLTSTALVYRSLVTREVRASLKPKKLLRAGRATGEATR